MRAQVTVIIPCYRCAETVGRAVASIAHQNSKPAEVILLDDAIWYCDSLRHTHEWLKNYRD